MANTIIRPEIFAKEVIRNRDKKNVFYNYANSAYTGELKMAWDTVTVQTLPTLSFVSGWTAWDAITATDFTITSESLVIDKVAQLRVTIKDIEKVQSNLSLESKVAERFAVAEANLLDDVILNEIIYTQFAAIDAVGNIIPAITAWKTTLFTAIENLKVKLANQNVSDSIVAFVSPQDASYIRQEGILDNSDSWLAIRQKGYMGMVSGIKIVESTALTGKKKIVAMQEGAVNCVVQLNKYDVRQGVDGFYENLLAEIIWWVDTFGENVKAIAIQLEA